MLANACADESQYSSASPRRPTPREANGVRCRHEASTSAVTTVLSESDRAIPTLCRSCRPARGSCVRLATTGNARLCAPLSCAMYHSQEHFALLAPICFAPTRIVSLMKPKASRFPAGGVAARADLSTEAPRPCDHDVANRKTIRSRQEGARVHQSRCGGQHDVPPVSTHHLARAAIIVLSLATVGVTCSYSKHDCPGAAVPFSQGVCWLDTRA